MYSLCVQRMCHLYIQLMCAENVSFDYKQVVMIYVLYKWCLLHLTKYKSGQEISNLAK